MGGDERLIAVLGHEVGHKLLGGCNTSVSEAFAEWLGARALAAALKENVQLSNPARKLVAGEEEGLTMADHVQALSKAADEDLAPWFRRLGITVNGAARGTGPRQD